MVERVTFSKAVSVVLALPFVLSACASPGVQTELVGSYEMIYVHSSERGARGETCQDGSGQFEISPGMRISGSITNTAGQTITHGGARVTGNTARGDFLMNGQDVGDFSGTYANGQWTGQYSAINGCVGAWTGKKV